MIPGEAQSKSVPLKIHTTLSWQWHVALPFNRLRAARGGLAYESENTRIRNGELMSRCTTIRVPAALVLAGGAPAGWDSRKKTLQLDERLIGASGIASKGASTPGIVVVTHA
jgi:hypothetical protein